MCVIRSPCNRTLKADSLFRTSQLNHAKNVSAQSQIAYHLWKPEHKINTMYASFRCNLVIPFNRYFLSHTTCLFWF